MIFVLFPFRSHSFCIQSTLAFIIGMQLAHLIPHYSFSMDEQNVPYSFSLFSIAFRRAVASINKRSACALGGVSRTFSAFLEWKQGRNTFGERFFYESVARLISLKLSQSIYFSKLRSNLKFATRLLFISQIYYKIFSKHFSHI